jgi:TrmH family RNA methyltransferase
LLRPLLCQATELILVKPHYPENVGAAARAAKTMGITRLCLVGPSRLATPDSEMAFKMAVRAWDVLESARVCETLAEALRGHNHVFATTARRGQKGLQTPREAAQLALQFAAEGKQIAVVFGNEKTGLSAAEVEACEYRIRIPMAADQPSINLAQSCQLVAYEWFLAGLEAFGVER